MLDLTTLNPAQKAAVEAPMGPVLVLAGAGSGKTRVLTFRVAYLIERGLVDAGKILALTFTNKASKEMQERVGKLLPAVSSSRPTVGTFHSVCARLLRREIHHLGYQSGFTILDSEDQGKVLRDILSELSVDRKFGAGLFKSLISRAKNVLQLPSELNIGLESEMHRLAQEVYVKYQDFLHRQNSLDFDDLLLLTARLFQARPDVLTRYREQFSYVLVDEYQDTNPAQYELLRLVVGDARNLFVVGDDAQSIYGFRGSSIRNILSFEEDFKNCTVLRLEQNYRSTGRILAVAEQVIGLNPEQKPKKLWTENEQGPKVEVRELPDETSEAEFVARSIVKAASPDSGELEYEEEEQDVPSVTSFSILDRFMAVQRRRGAKSFRGLAAQLPQDHGPLSGTCVLLRTHAQTRSFEEAFMNSGIPYQIVGGLRFYERKEVKDLLAYLRLALSPTDVIATDRVINEPARGVGPKSFEKIREFLLTFPAGNQVDAADVRAGVLGLRLAPKAAAGADAFYDAVATLYRIPEETELPEVVKAAIKLGSFEKSLRDGTEKGEARWENVQELVTVSDKFRGEPWRTASATMLEEVALVADTDKSPDADRVTIMTLHAAKGLEFDTVFFAGLEEGILPHSRSVLDPAELSEEVRLAYVGLTRARRKLYLTFASNRTSFGQTKRQVPSRILSALPEDHVTFHTVSGIGRGGSDSSITVEPFYE